MFKLLLHHDQGRCKILFVEHSLSLAGTPVPEVSPGRNKVGRLSRTSINKPARFQVNSTISHHDSALVVYGASTVDETVYLLGGKRRRLPAV